VGERVTAMRIEIRDGRMAFLPGETLSGTAERVLEDSPKSVELRLYWQTSGKGRPDVEVAAVVPFEHPGSLDRREFRLTLPAGPYSFSGKLVSLAWGLELLALPAGEVERAELTISPTGESVRLHRG
jgi:hypothetical protein